MNLFQYLFTHSAHSGKVFCNLISGELRRYLILSSDLVSFLDVASKFCIRLLRRGYKEHLIKEVFRLTSFDQRSDIMSRLSIRQQNPRVISAAPPIFNLAIPYVARTRDLLLKHPGLVPETWLSAYLPAKRKAKIRVFFKLPSPLLRIFSRFPADGPPSSTTLPLLD